MDKNRIAAMKLASTFGRLHNMRFVFEGERMSTDGEKTIYYPAWDLSDPETYEAIVGLCYHEPGHHVFDCTTTWKVWLKSKGVRQAIFKIAENILSDIRLEYHMMRRYPGAKYALKALTARVHMGTPVADYSDNNPVRAMMDYTLYDHRMKSLNQVHLQPKRDPIAAEALRILGRDALEKIEDIRLRGLLIGPQKSDYPQVLTLAEELVQLLYDLQEESQEQQQEDSDGDGQGSQGEAGSEQQSGGGSSDGSPDDGDKDAGGDADAQSAQASDPDQSPTDADASAPQAGDGSSDKAQGKGDKPSTTGGQASSGSSNGASEGAGGQPSPEMRPDAGDSSAGSASAADGAGSPEPASPPSGQPSKAPPSRKGPLPNLDWSKVPDPDDYDVAAQLEALLPKADAPYDVSFSPHAGAGHGGTRLTRPLTSELAAAQPLIRSLRSSLSDFVQSAEIEQCSFGRRGRSIASSRVHRIFGDGRSFRRRSVTTSESVHVSLLVDFSQSTAGINQALAVTTVALSKALTALDDVERSIYGFPDADSNLFEIVHARGKDQAFYNAWPTSFGSGTPLFSALLDLIPLLLAVEKDRKAILCVTDGQPHADDRQVALSALKRSGIEFYGVVIGCQSYDDSMFDASRKIAKVQQLPDAVKELSQEILKQRPQAA